jgi:hypothetical protein
MFHFGKHGRAAMALAWVCALGVAHAADNGMAGTWGYRDSCKFSHSATIAITPSAEGYTGQWSDGSNVSGDSGTFKGTLRDGKLFVRFCSEQGEQGGFRMCPTYAATDDAYLTIEGKNLAWYNHSGAATENTFARYVVLHRTARGKRVAAETKCPADSQ